MAKHTIGEFLATLRKANGYTQQDVADKLGVSNRTISAWECGTVLPDILLLPALAELYGVTTDEILNGEKKQVDTPALTKKSETKLYKNRISRFTMQSYILTGIFAVGLILFYVGMSTYLSTYVWVSWRWWLLLLYLGLSIAVISATILIAFWKSAETSIDDEDEKCGSFCILLRRRVSLCAYFCAALSLLLTIVAIIYMLNHYPLKLLLAVMLILTFVLFFGGFALYRRGLRLWGNDEMRTQLKKHIKLCEKVALWGLIPLVIGIGVIIFFNFYVGDIKHRYYSSESITEFTEHMETLVYEEVIVNPDDDNDVEFVEVSYYIPLSELARTAESRKVYEFENNFTYQFSDDKLTCRISRYYIDEYGHKTTSYFKFVRRISTNDGSYSVYDLRYGDKVSSSLNNFYGYDFLIEFKESRYWYVLHEYYKLPQYRYIGLAVIVADFFVCSAICGIKRQKIKIKL